MKRLLPSLCALCLFCAPAFATGDQPSKPGVETYPPLAPRPYRLAVSPSHVASPLDPLLASPDQWKNVAGNIDFYKYYGVQFLGSGHFGSFDPSALVAVGEERKFALGCEFGDFHIGADGCVAGSPADLAIAQLAPIFAAGGRVDSLHLDDPVRRLMGCDPPNAKHLNFEQAKTECVRFWQKLHAKYPALRIGLISNLPNWDYSDGLPGYNGDYTRRSGLTYRQVLEGIHSALSAAGQNLAFFEVDCPFNYYREPRTRTGDAPLDNEAILADIQTWCRGHGIPFHLVVNAEPRGRGPEGFKADTLAYVRQLRRDGIFPDCFIIQSWYEEPREHIPETREGTFMNTARDARALIRELYPNTEPVRIIPIHEIKQDISPDEARSPAG